MKAALIIALVASVSAMRSIDRPCEDAPIDCAAKDEEMDICNDPIDSVAYCPRYCGKCDGPEPEHHCRDYDKHCYQLVNSEYCQKDIARELCAESCGLCAPPTEPPTTPLMFTQIPDPACQDIDPHCIALLQVHYCSDEKLVRKLCQRSCNMCPMITVPVEGGMTQPSNPGTTMEPASEGPKVCRDYDSICLEDETIANCSNDELVSRLCPLSCGVCHLPTSATPAPTLPSLNPFTPDQECYDNDPDCESLILSFNCSEDQVMTRLCPSSCGLCQSLTTPSTNATQAPIQCVDYSADCVKLQPSCVFDLLVVRLCRKTCNDPVCEAEGVVTAKPTGTAAPASQKPASQGPAVVSQGPVVTQGPGSGTPLPVVSQGPVTADPGVTQAPPSQGPVASQGPVVTQGPVTQGPVTQEPVVSQGPVTQGPVTGTPAPVVSQGPAVVSGGPTQAPPVVTQGPSQGPASPVVTPGQGTPAPAGTTQAPGSVTQGPSQQPPVVTQGPGAVTQGPGVTQAPVVSQGPGEVTQAPAGTTQGPAVVTQGPGAVTQSPDTQAPAASILPGVTLGATTLVPPELCFDRDFQCPLLITTFFCETNDLLRSICPKSCNLCVPPTTAAPGGEVLPTTPVDDTCADFDPQCGELAGYCNREDMLINRLCRKTCGTCGADIGLPVKQDPLPLTCRVCIDPFCKREVESVAKCPEEAPYCASRVMNNADGSQGLTKRCASKVECDHGYAGTAAGNDTMCSNYDANAVVQEEFICFFCCRTNECNKHAKPDADTLYIKN